MLLDTDVGKSTRTFIQRDGLYRVVQWRLEVSGWLLKIALKMGRLVRVDILLSTDMTCWCDGGILRSILTTETDNLAGEENTWSRHRRWRSMGSIVREILILNGSRSRVHVVCTRSDDDWSEVCAYVELGWLDDNDVQVCSINDQWNQVRACAVIGKGAGQTDPWHYLALPEGASSAVIVTPGRGGVGALEAGDWQRL